MYIRSPSLNDTFKVSLFREPSFPSEKPLTLFITIFLLCSSFMVVTLKFWSTKHLISRHVFSLDTSTSKFHDQPGPCWLQTLSSIFFSDIFFILDCSLSKHIYIYFTAGMSHLLSVYRAFLTFLDNEPFIRHKLCQTTWWGHKVIEILISLLLPTWNNIFLLFFFSLREGMVFFGCHSLPIKYKIGIGIQQKIVRTMQNLINGI
jgi:hypothetical protein